MVAKARIREFLQAINVEQKVTVLLTTHDMDDVEMLCRRMLIIDHGRKLYDGTVDNIRARFGGERVLISEFSPGALATLPQDDTGQPLLKELPAGVRQVRIAWLGARCSLRDVTFQEPEIEDVIRCIYENGLLL